MANTKIREAQAGVPTGGLTNEVLTKNSNTDYDYSWVAGGGGPGGGNIGDTVSGGTPGSVLFVGVGPVLAQDNANFFWDDTNNRLGIGTNSPTALVEITSPSTTKGLVINMDNVGSQVTGLQIVSADPTTGGPVLNNTMLELQSTDTGVGGGTMQFYHNSATPAVSDNVGMIEFAGNTDAVTKTRYGLVFCNIVDPTFGSTDGQIVFHVQAAGTTARRMSIEPAFNGIAVGNSVADGVLSSTGNSGLVLQTGNATTGTITIQDGADGDFILMPNGTGMVGVGTASPNQQLEITGSFRLPTSTSTDGIIFSGANRYIHNFGTNNFFAGVGAGNLTLTGNDNVGVGPSALASVTIGNNNTAIGKECMSADVVGDDNTAVGLQSMFSAGSAATNNTAVGSLTLSAATFSGIDNVVVGQAAGLAMTSGSENVLVGQGAGDNITTGDANIGIGADALDAVSTGTRNVAIGRSALEIATGNDNIAIGDSADISLTTGSGNITIGRNTDSATLGGSNQLNISNVIYGLDLSSVGSTPAGRVGIGTNAPNASAILDLTSTIGALLLPRMTTAQRDALTAVNGMVIYNSTTDKFQGYEAGAWANLI